VQSRCWAAYELSLENGFTGSPFIQTYQVENHDNQSHNSKREFTENDFYNSLAHARIIATHCQHMFDKGLVKAMKNML
jgi:hypothetical protein